jgi:uncharacterized repeat protein (TIGR01451 family)
MGLANIDLLADATEECSGGFIVHYEDDPGFGDEYGFYDQTLAVAPVTCAGSTGGEDCTIGQVRRETMCAVLDYLTTIIDIQDKTPEVLMRESEGDGTGPLAKAFIPVFNAQNIFWGGPLHHYITQGEDITSPTTGIFGSGGDAFIEVDFGPRLNGVVTINNDYKLDSSINQLDLFTILLHEMTHSLGFTDGLNESGNPVFQGTGFDAFGLLAQNFVDENGDFLVDGGQGSFLGPIGLLTTPGAIKYQVNDDIAYTMYTPSTYSSISSLKHFDNIADNTVYLMQPSISADHPDIREFTPAEIHFLCKVGYQLFSPYDCNNITQNGPPVGILDEPLSTTPFSQTIYPGDSICVDVLANDTDPENDDLFVDPDYIQIVSGGGVSNISLNANQEICYTAPSSFFGTALILYRPHDGNQLGNVTEVQIDVLPNTCPGSCNLLCNGGFEEKHDIWLDLGAGNGLFINTEYGVEQNNCPAEMLKFWCVTGAQTTNRVRVLSTQAPEPGSGSTGSAFFIPNGGDIMMSNNGVSIEPNTPPIGLGETNNRFVALQEHIYELNGSIGILHAFSQILTQELKPNIDFRLQLDAFGAWNSELEPSPSVFVIRGFDVDGNDTLIGSNGQIGDIKLEVPIGQWSTLETVFQVSADTVKLEFYNEFDFESGTNRWVFVDNFILGPADPQIGFVNADIQTDSDQLSLGAMITFNVGACAQGASAEDIGIEFVLPSGLNLVSTTMSDYPNHTFDSIAEGECEYREVKAIVAQSYPDGLEVSFCNSITDSSLSYSCNQGEGNQQSCLNLSMKHVDIDLNKVVLEENVNTLGDIAAYQIEISNLSDLPAHNVKIAELPPGNFEISELAFSSASNGDINPEFSLSSNNQVLTIATLPAGTTYRFKVDLKMVSYRFCKTELENRIELIGLDETDTNFDNNMAMVPMNIPACQGDLAVEKKITVPGPYYLDGFMYYGIIIRNLGNTPLLVSKIKDIIPPELTFVTAAVAPVPSGTTVNIDSDGTIIVGNLASGAEVTVKMKFKIQSTINENLCKLGVVNSVVGDLVSQMDINPENNSADAPKFTVKYPKCSLIGVPDEVDPTER